MVVGLPIPGIGLGSFSVQYSTVLCTTNCVDKDYWDAKGSEMGSSSPSYSAVRVHPGKVCTVQVRSSRVCIVQFCARSF